ncbi:MAG: hypothetical protein QGH39_08805, partial [Candidatus Thermoplasmatota archaeon]|nr:hypothetical protein [Candidatus Thermoplasmatota archaeon]
EIILGFGETRFSITCRKPQVFEGVAEPVGSAEHSGHPRKFVDFLRESKFDHLIMFAVSQPTG